MSKYVNNQCVNPKRIIFVAHRIPYPPNKGEKLRTFHQIRHLCDKGLETIVFAPVDTTDDINHAKALSDLLNIRVITQSLPAKWLRMTKALCKGISLSEGNFFSSSLCARLCNEVRENDVIICSASSLYAYLETSGIISTHRCMIDFMDVDSDKWLQYANSSAWPMSLVYKRESNLIRTVEYNALKNCHQCFVIAEPEQRLLQKQFGYQHGACILPNGIDSTVFKPVAKQTLDEVRFLFVGVMDYKPNIDAVVWFVKQCWADIKRRVPSATFTIAGMNPSVAVQNLASHDIEVTGFVDDIMPFFDRADVFVAPFRLARGVQNKVLQAMACGLPVISTSCGIEGIDANDKQHYWLAEDSQQFIDACCDLASDSVMREQLGASANQQILALYSWDSVLRPLELAVGLENMRVEQVL